MTPNRDLVELGVALTRKSGCRLTRLCRYTCPTCGGALRILACIEDPVVIEKILAHLDAKAAAAQAARPPPCRDPPQAGLRGEPAGAAQVD